MNATERVLEAPSSWLPRLMAIFFFLAFAIVALAIYVFMAVLFATFVLYAADQGQPPVAVVARVNGMPITELELSRVLTTAGPAAHARSPKLTAEVQARALDELIVRELKAGGDFAKLAQEYLGDAYCNASS